MRSFFVMFICVSLLALAGCSPAATQVPTQAAVQPQPEASGQPAAGQEIILATTTSTQDSGLLDAILPLFEEQTGIRVSVIAVGSGQALEMGQNGDADLMLVHSPAKEKEFMDAGHGIRREDVMYNDFVIVGPADDPAKISGLTSATDAFKAIAAADAKFVSRGDDSGTHTKELSVWKAAGVEPAGGWYVSVGQGMGAVLTMAQELPAYTLSDRATYLSMTQTGLDLQVLVEGDTLLLNPYGVIAVNPDKSPKIQADLANQFIDWLISVPVQEQIAAFRKADFGQSLFIPSSRLWKENQ